MFTCVPVTFAVFGGREWGGRVSGLTYHANEDAGRTMPVLPSTVISSPPDPDPQHIMNVRVRWVENVQQHLDPCKMYKFVNVTSF